MSFNINWNIDRYKAKHESEEEWNLRKTFMENLKRNYPEEKLVPLSRMYANITFKGHTYPKEVMKEVAQMAEEVIRKLTIKNSVGNSSYCNYSGDNESTWRRLPNEDITGHNPNSTQKNYLDFPSPSQETITQQDSLKVCIKANKPISQDDSVLLQNEILKSISSYDKGIKFLCCSTEAGCFTVTCANEESRDWLDKQIPTLEPWDGAQLIIVNDNKQPSMETGVKRLWIPNDNLDSNSLMELWMNPKTHLFERDPKSLTMLTNHPSLRNTETFPVESYRNFSTESSEMQQHPAYNLEMMESKKRKQSPNVASHGQTWAAFSGAKRNKTLSNDKQRNKIEPSINTSATLNASSSCLRPESNAHTRVVSPSSQLSVSPPGDSLGKATNISNLREGFKQPLECNPSCQNKANSSHFSNTTPVTDSSPDKVKVVKMNGAARKRFRRLIAANVGVNEARAQAVKPWSQITIQNVPPDPKPRKRKIPEAESKKQSKKAPKLETTQVIRTDVKLVAEAKRVGIRNITSMTDDQANQVHRSLTLAILNIADRGKGPKFTDFKHEPGWILVTCENQGSLEWLEREVPKIKPWTGAELSVIPERELPKPMVAVTFLPSSEVASVDEAIQLLRAQNKGLNTEFWKVMHSKSEKKGYMVTFSLDDMSVEALRAVDFQATLGFAKVTFMIRDGSESKIPTAD